MHSIDGLREGMVLPGIVTNVAAFGAFVDIGVKQDGLVHVSELSDRYVASPFDAVRLRQQVRVRVVSVDRRRGRIGLSMPGIGRLRPFLRGADVLTIRPKAFTLRKFFGRFAGGRSRAMPRGVLPDGLPPPDEAGSSREPRESSQRFLSRPR